MMLQRRQLRGTDTYHSHPVWTEEELERQRELAMQEGRRRRNQHHFLTEEDAEDPLLMFGRMVKDAGKTLLRKVSVKDLSRKGTKEKNGARKKDSGISGQEKVNEPETSADETPTSKEDQRPAPTPRTLEDDEETFQMIGHTETIREGDAKHIWITEDLLGSPTGWTSTQLKYISH
ncbi:hypothetical protein J132_09658 [Termitomyces sp. J132]|nr:hypothetical protein J132_09658 [Termitomyces sp. J132]